MSNYNLQFTWSGFDAANRVISGADFQTEFEAIQTAVNSKLDTTNAGFAEAWVNFTGTGTVAINDSYNVTSITDRGTGFYKVNMTNSISTAYPAIVGICASDNFIELDNVDITVDDFDIYTRDVSSGGTLDDAPMVTVAVIA